MPFARGFPSSPLALSKGFLKPMSDSGLVCAQARVFAQRIEEVREINGQTHNAGTCISL